MLPWQVPKGSVSGEKMREWERSGDLTFPKRLFANIMSWWSMKAKEGLSQLRNYKGRREEMRLLRMDYRQPKLAAGDFQTSIQVFMIEPPSFQSSNPHVGPSRGSSTLRYFTLVRKYFTAQRVYLREPKRAISLGINSLAKVINLHLLEDTYFNPGATMPSHSMS